MSTRALIRIYDGDEEITCIYRHCDGYPERLGVELRDFCASKVIVNGIRMDADQKKIASGMGCLAAQLVALLKDGPGGVYIMKPGTSDHGEEYEYQIRGPNWKTANGQHPSLEAFSVGSRARSVEPVEIPERP